MFALWLLRITMQSFMLKPLLNKTSKELILLLLASLACVVILMTGLGGAAGPRAGALDVHYLVLALILAGLAALGVVTVRRATTRARVEAQRARAESLELQRSLAAAEAIVKAEPHVLVMWENEQPLKVLTHTLSGVPGVPSSKTELLHFGQWLESRSADEFRGGLDTLFANGRPFNVILKTKAGGYLEADGRATGGRAVLRMRDVAGYKRDLIGVLDRHQRLSGEIRTSRALLDALPMPVWIKGTDGRINWVNAAYVKAVEATSAGEVLQRQIELLESRQRQGVDRALARGQSYRKRVQLVLQGERKTHDIIVLPLEDATAAAAIDVTAVETAKGELDRQVAAYDRTLDRVPTAVAIFNREQRLTFFNAAYLSLWQIDAAWLETGPGDGAILDRLRELGRLPEVVNYREWKTKLLSSYKTGVEQEDWWHLPDGRVLHVMADLRPDGGVTYLYVDETERLSLEGRYNALINVQRETLDSLKEAVCVFATDGRLKLHNSAFAAIWKLPNAVLERSPHIDEIIALSQGLYDDQRTWSQISRAVTSFSDEREPLEGQMVRPDNTLIDYATTPLPDGATLVTFADVTDRKRYERALLERNEALMAADRLKNQFIGHVSYELRTPLTNIIGFSELLANPRTGTLNDKQRDYLNDITSSSKTLLAIIDDILDLTTIDAGSLELKLARVSVRSVIDAAILGVRERAIRARLTLDIAIADDATHFVADEARVRQVLYNLLSNAVGFSNTNDTIHITCWREGGKIVFTVQDQGVGIPKEQQARVFERFESRSHGSNHRGAGLGLSIVKSLVELHGGDMALASEPGRGTLVTVRFPERGLARRGAPVVTPQAQMARGRTPRGTAA